jgi:hypothetical protein
LATALDGELRPSEAITGTTASEKTNILDRANMCFSAGVEVELDLERALPHPPERPGRRPKGTITT